MSFRVRLWAPKICFREAVNCPIYAQTHSFGQLAGRFSRQAHGSYRETHGFPRDGYEFDRKSFRESDFEAHAQGAGWAPGSYRSAGWETVMFTSLCAMVGGGAGRPMEDPSGDILIVLGGSALEEGITGQSSYLAQRVCAAALPAESVARVIVSGGGQFRPADSMRDFPVASGTPANRITVEDRSVSTRENALCIRSNLWRGTTGV
jgi:hypothetical protein